MYPLIPGRTRGLLLPFGRCERAAVDVCVQVCFRTPVSSSWGGPRSGSAGYLLLALTCPHHLSLLNKTCCDRNAAPREWLVPCSGGGSVDPPPGLGDIAYSLTLKAQVAARGLVTCMAPKGRPEAGGCQGATTPPQLLLPSLYLGQMIRFCLSRRPPVRLDPGHMVRVSVCPLCSLPAGRVPAALRGSRAVAMVTRRGASGAGGASES